MRGVEEVANLPYRPSQSRDTAGPSCEPRADRAPGPRYPHRHPLMAPLPSCSGPLETFVRIAGEAQYIETSSAHFPELVRVVGACAKVGLMTQIYEPCRPRDNTNECSGYCGAIAQPTCIVFYDNNDEPMDVSVYHRLFRR